MRELESYTIHELEELTGVNRRTISYYIAEGLLPRVGRRGRHARYGREFLDRLRLIQRIKDQQDAGKLPAATLAEIGAFIATLDSDDVVAAGKANQKLLELFAEWPGVDAPSESAEMSDGAFRPPDPTASYSFDTAEFADESLESPVREMAQESRAMPEISVGAMYSAEPAMAASMKVDSVDAAIRERVEQLTYDLQNSIRAAEKMADYQRQLLDENRKTIEQIAELLDETRHLRAQLEHEIDQSRRLHREIASSRGGLLGLFRKKPAADPDKDT